MDWGRGGHVSEVALTKDREAQIPQIQHQIIIKHIQQHILTHLLKRVQLYLIEVCELKSLNSQ